MVFGGGTRLFREVRSSWFAREEKREAALNHQGLKHETLSHVGLLLRPLWVHSFKCIVFLSFLFFIVYFSAGGNRFLLVDFAQRISVRLQSVYLVFVVKYGDQHPAWVTLHCNINNVLRNTRFLLLLLDVLLFSKYASCIFAAHVLICNIMHSRFSCMLTVTEGQVLLQRCVLVPQQR